ncbi:GGDEF domain-containing protein [Vallitaleaceae bacterium 9-2]
MRKKYQSLRLEDQIFAIILTCAMAMSIALIVVNIIIDYPMIANVKWVISLIMSGFVLYALLKQRYVMPARFIFFSVVIIVLLPLGWLNSSLTNPFTVAYSFLIMIAVIYFFEGKVQLFFFTIELIIMMLMIFLRYQFPQVFTVLHSKTEMADVMYQLPLTFIAGAFMLKSFAKSYRYALDKLEEQKKALTYLTLHDELTTIYNRRYVFREIDKIRQSKETKVLIGMVDLDNFKRINDSYGHVMGDMLLKKAATTIRDIVGEQGVVGRYGGDEFIIIYRGCSKAKMLELLNKIQEASNRLGSLEAYTSYSGGFVLCRQHSRIEEALADADQLLYTSKHRGKNTITYQYTRRDGTVVHKHLVAQSDNANDTVLESELTI